MPQTIWKFAIPVEPRFSLSLPEGAQPLFVGVQDNAELLWMWVRLDPQAPPEQRNFALYGTGHPLNPGVYIGSFMLEGGALVFHLFEEP